jgi:hypothetical protein
MISCGFVDGIENLVFKIKKTDFPLWVIYYNAAEVCFVGKFDCKTYTV